MIHFESKRHIQFWTGIKLLGCSQNNHTNRAIKGTNRAVKVLSATGYNLYVVFSFIYGHQRSSQISYMKFIPFVSLNVYIKWVTSLYSTHS